MHHQCSQIRITALADTEQSILTTRTVLPRCQSQQGGKLSAIGKLTGITESDDERCDDHWTDTAQLLKANGGRLVCRDRSDLAVELAYTPIQRTKVVPQTIQQTTKACRQTVIRIL